MTNRSTVLVHIFGHSGYTNLCAAAVNDDRCAYIPGSRLPSVPPKKASKGKGKAKAQKASKGKGKAKAQRASEGKGKAKANRADSDDESIDRMMATMSLAGT